MAGRYTEARLYLVGASVSLLLMVWATLAVQDRQEREAAVLQAQASEPATLSAGGTDLTRLPAAVLPHTRTRAS